MFGGKYGDEYGQDRALEALRLLKEADAERGASRTVEASLLAHRKFAPTRRVGRWVWAVPVFACLAAVAVSVVRWQADEARKPVALIAVRAPSVPTDWSRRTKPSRFTPSVAEPEEVATEFFPLSDVEFPMERGTLVRTVVPASTMLRVGMPVQADYWNAPLTADVLYGDEGTARAIRFVTFR